MSKTYYLGLDVHKEKIAIAYATAGDREEPVYYGKCAASVQNIERTLRKIARKLGAEFRDLKVCYEARTSRPSTPGSNGWSASSSRCANSSKSGNGSRWWRP